MMRRIQCSKCGTRGYIPQSSEDVASGWHTRIKHIEAKRPAGHAIAFTSGNKTREESLPTILCDGCMAPIMDGDRAVAITMYQGIEPPLWEADYGTIV